MAYNVWCMKVALKKILHFRFNKEPNFYIFNREIMGFKLGKLHESNEYEKIE